MIAGVRVRLLRDVDRFPHFVAKAGATGTIVSVDDHAVSVKMDEHLPGCEEWDNCIWWYDDWNANRDALEFTEDVEAA